MRKFLFSGAVMGAVFGVWPVIRKTRSGPKDWRLALTWIGWSLSVAAAAGDVVEDSRRRAREAEAADR